MGFRKIYLIYKSIGQLILWEQPSITYEDVYIMLTESLAFVGIKLASNENVQSSQFAIFESDVEFTPI